MGRILDFLRNARRPVVRAGAAVVDFLISKPQTDTATYPDGTKETVEWGGGILRDRTTLAALTTAVITVFNIEAETTEVIEIVVNVANLASLLLTAIFAKQKVTAK